jgi:nucleoside-triphosphatase THEP1
MAAFGQLVTGPPGAGKSTYCHGMHQFLTALNRPVHIINLDPAVPNPPYPCAVNITDLISLEEIMEEHSLGPNGAMLYAMEYLEANFDWLEEELGKLVEEEERGACYVIIDTPGQVELWTNHDSLKRIVGRLIKADYRVSSPPQTPPITPNTPAARSSPPLRRALRNRRIKIHLRPPPRPPCNAPTRDPPHKRPLQNGPHHAIRRTTVQP